MATQQADVGEEGVNPRILVLADLINKAFEDGWFDDNLEIVENIIIMLPKKEPKHSKQRTYAVRRLEAAEYKRARDAGEVPRSITEDQIAAEMALMEQKKSSMKAK